MNYSIGIILSLCQLVALSIDSETQTSWSGASNILGPVLSWGEDYYLCQSTAFSQGDLILGASEHVVDDSFLGVRSIYTDDIDLDGNMDILGASYGLDEICWWSNNGDVIGQWVKYIVDSDFGGARGICSTDINNDGYPDIIAAGYNAGQVAWWQNPGSYHGVWVKHVIDDDFNDAWSVHPADINDDGMVDVIGCAVNGTLRWWRSTKCDGTGWIENTICTDIGSARSVNSCDIDGDGDTDLICASYHPGKVFWFENTDGTGSTMEKHVIKTLGGAHSVFPGDIDQDGDQDVVACGQNGDRIVWYEFITDSYDYWEVHPIRNSFDGARSIHALDMDGDGDLDVAGVASNCDEVGWWENLGGGIDWNEHMLGMCSDGGYSARVAALGTEQTLYVIIGDYLRDRVSLFSLDPAPSASLESSIFALGNDPEWGNLSWYPVMTGISFQIRASDDHTQMGDWSVEVVSPGGISGLLQDNNSFFQYRVLFRNGAGLTPFISEITVSWNSVSIEDCTVPVEWETDYLAVSPNPSSDNVSVSFYLTQPADVSLYILDISGRVVWSNFCNSTAGAATEILLPELLPGIYFCKIISESCHMEERFVVTR